MDSSSASQLSSATAGSNGPRSLQHARVEGALLRVVPQAAHAAYHTARLQAVCACERTFTCCGLICCLVTLAPVWASGAGSTPALQVSGVPAALLLTLLVWQRVSPASYRKQRVAVQSIWLAVILACYVSWMQGWTAPGPLAARQEPCCQGWPAGR